MDEYLQTNINRLKHLYNKRCEMLKKILTKAQIDMTRAQDSDSILKIYDCTEDVNQLNKISTLIFATTKIIEKENNNA